MGKRRAKGEGGITQRKDGLWMATLTVGRDSEGKPKRKNFYARTKAEVTEKLDNARHDARNGQYKEPEKRTLGQWLDEWLEVWKTDLRQTTRESYQYQIKAHIKPELEYIPLVNLDGSILQKFINDKYKKTNLSQRSIKYIHTILKASLEKAFDEEYIKKNPAKKLTHPKEEIPDSKNNDIGFEYFTLEEVRQLMDLIKHDKYYPAYYLAIYTGMRRGELLALRWRDIDLDKGTVSINKNLVRIKAGLVFQPPKTKPSMRENIIKEDVCEILKFHKARQNKDKDNASSAWQEKLLFRGKEPENNDLVFTNKIGNPLDPRSFSVHFKKLLKDTELEGKTFHMLRHTYATLSLQEGVTIKSITANLGHHSTAFTMDVYSKDTPTMSEASADILSRAIKGE